MPFLIYYLAKLYIVAILKYIDYYKLSREFKQFTTNQKEPN